jgi:hypothetical protein
MDLIEFQASLLGRAADDVAVGATLNGAKVHLTKGSVDINPDTTVAELDAVECDYTGYAATAIVWGTPVVADDGNVEVICTQQTYQPTDAVTPNVVYAVYITDTTSAILYFAGVIPDGPLPMGTALDQIKINVRYRPQGPSLVALVS